MPKLVITLEEEDLLDLHEVLLDDDEKAALEFIKARIAPKIPGKGTSHCDSSRFNPYLITPDPSTG
jgi:hypothetical protein